MDPIADLLTCIRNANLALKPEISVPHSTIKESAVRILKDEGYLESFNVEGDVKRNIRIQLKFQGRKGIITGLHPGCATTPRPMTFRSCWAAWALPW